MKRTIRKYTQYYPILHIFVCQKKANTAIITGSSRGIGKETAISLAKREVNVVVCSKIESQINSIVREINEIIEKENNNNHFE